MSTLKRIFLFSVCLSFVCISIGHIPDAAAKKNKVVTIRYATMDAKQSWTARNSLLPWMADAEKAANNQIKFEPYWSNTLSKPLDNWESVKSGVADAGDCVMAFWPGLAPLSDVISLPFIGVESGEQGGAVLWQLYEKFPSIQAEFKAVHVLFLGVSNPNILMTVKKQVKTISDIEGMKIRVTGGPPTAYLKSINVSPMLVAMTDVYMNLQKGVIDGVVSSYTTVETMKFHETIKYLADIPFYSPYAARVMNLNTWKSLSPEVQDAITSMSGYERSILFSKTQFDDHVQLVRDKGYDIVEYTPTPEELVQWQQSARPIWDKWVKDMTAAGHPEAQEILDTTLALLKSYKK